MCMVDEPGNDRTVRSGVAERHDVSLRYARGSAAEFFDYRGCDVPISLDLVFDNGRRHA